MEIIVRRQHFGENFTISKMFFDGEDRGIFVLEDRVREVDGEPVSSWKVVDQTAIPCGTYKVVFDFSNRFQKIMPHILDVPGFEGVRIHSGNTDKDTSGCLILGKDWDGYSDFVSDSKAAIKEFLNIVEDCKKITLTVTGIR